jgi:Phage integrase family
VRTPLWLPDEKDRWRCLLVDDDAESGADELAFFCPDCAKRELSDF